MQLYCTYNAKTPAPTACRCMYVRNAIMQVFKRARDIWWRILFYRSGRFEGCALILTIRRGKSTIDHDLMRSARFVARLSDEFNCCKDGSREAIVRLGRESRDFFYFFIDFTKDENLVHLI